MVPDKTPAAFGWWAFNMLCMGIVLRIGWEIGGRLWAVF
jgi:hypothetical protein